VIFFVDRGGVVGKRNGGGFEGGGLAGAGGGGLYSMVSRSVGNCDSRSWDI